MSDPRQNLKWVPGVVLRRPAWTNEPNITAISELVRSYFGLNSKEDVEVQLHAQGTFNKVYTVTPRSGETLIFRVALPVDPHYKTLSEAATLTFLKDQTSIPVPGLLAFSAQGTDDLPYEWLLMEKSPGKPLKTVWDSMTWPKKVDAVKAIAKHQADLSFSKFPSIGSLYQTSKFPNLELDYGLDSSQDEEFPVGRICSYTFFWDQNYTFDVPRGAFSSSREWLSAILSLYLKDAERQITTARSNGTKVRRGKALRRIVRRLQEQLDVVFPPGEEIEEQFVLYHDDLSFDNILADDEGNITAFMDWECVNTVPLYKCMEMPSCLLGPDLELDDFPNPSNSLNRQNRHYEEQLRAYEFTRLRKIFVDEMKVLSPDWSLVQQNDTLRRQADLECAIQYCESYENWPLIDSWLDNIDRGFYRNFKEFF